MDSYIKDTLSISFVFITCLVIIILVPPKIIEYVGYGSIGYFVASVTRRI